MRSRALLTRCACASAHSRTCDPVSGPYCAVCELGFHGGRDGVLCSECVGSAGLSITGILVGGISGFLVLVLILFRIRRWYKRIMDRLQLKAAERDASSAADQRRGSKSSVTKLASEHQKEQVQKLLKLERPWLYVAQKWLGNHSVSVGVKFRILLSLYQVLNGVGIVFDSA